MKKLTLVLMFTLMGLSAFAQRTEVPSEHRAYLKYLMDTYLAPPNSAPIPIPLAEWNDTSNDGVEFWEWCFKGGVLSVVGNPHDPHINFQAWQEYNIMGNMNQIAEFEILADGTMYFSCIGQHVASNAIPIDGGLSFLGLAGLGFVARKKFKFLKK